MSQFIDAYLTCLKSKTREDRLYLSLKEGASKNPNPVKRNHKDFQIIFAFIPPVDYAGGSLCFVISIAGIGVLTAV